MGWKHKVLCIRASSAMASSVGGKGRERSGKVTWVGTPWNSGRQAEFRQPATVSSCQAPQAPQQCSESSASPRGSTTGGKAVDAPSGVAGEGSRHGDTDYGRQDIWLHFATLIVEIGQHMDQTRDRDLMYFQKLD